MVVCTVAYVIVRRVLGLVGVGPAPDAKDIEIAVLRHQLMVLRRQDARPRYTRQDRLVWTLLARLLPRERWPAFLVTPATLLRWHRELVARRWAGHRELVARRWAYPPTGRGRQCLPSEVVDLVVRIALDNPRWGYLRIVGSAANLACGCRRRRCGGSCAATGSARHPGAVARVGRRSCAPRLPGCWRATSSPWRQSD
jgi:hypothetical protein